METYTYQVIPRKPIRGLVNGKIITRPQSFLLTKDDVKFCLKHGSVYRRFPSGECIKVYPDSIDRLHRATHMSEAEYKKMITTKEQAIIEKPVDDSYMDKSVVDPALESEVEVHAEAFADVVNEDNVIAVVDPVVVEESGEEKNVEEEQSDIVESEPESAEVVEEEVERPVQEIPVMEMIPEAPSKKNNRKSSKKKPVPSKNSEIISSIDL